MEDHTNISQERLEQIERYLDNKMDEMELIHFKNELSINRNLAQQVEDIKSLIFGIETFVLKEKLDGFHKDIPDTQPEIKYKNQFSKFMAIAASIVILLGGFWFFNQNPNIKLFDTYFSPDPGLPTTMSSNDNYEFYEAMVNYKQGKYKTAIEKWEAIETKNDTINYFLGVAHLANKNEKKAIRYLEKAAKIKDFPFLSDTYYYLGLAYLKADNVELAKKNLNFSTIDNSKKILSKLND